jgi:metallophosphoesterase superfamily enzyme
MNYLMQRDNEFVVSPAIDPCTQGVDVSSTFLTQAQFLEGSSTATATDKPLLTFIDLEGSVSTVGLSSCSQPSCAAC